MRRGMLGILVLALALVGSPARAGSTYGSTTGVNGVLYDDCVDQPYRYSVSVPDGAGYRAIRAWLYAPGGALVDSDYVVPDTNTASGTSTFRLCRPTDPFGTYTIRATVEWGQDAEHIDDSSVLDRASFAMRKPRTRTALAVSTHRPAYGQRVTYRITVRDERPGGYARTPFAWVVLQQRVGGHWARIKGSRTLTHDTGRVRLRLRYLHHHQRLRIRAVAQATSRYSRSTSPVVRIW